MKKVIGLALVALLMCGVAFARTGPGIGDIMGQGKLDSDPHKVFRLVRYCPPDTTDALFSTASSLTADSIVIWDCNSDDGVTVTTTTTSYDSAVAGVVVLAILTPDYGTQGISALDAIGKRNWGWLQTYGKSEVYMQVDGVASAKSALACGSKPGGATLFLGSTTSSTVQGNAGFFYDAATAAATDVEVFLRCE